MAAGVWKVGEMGKREEGGGSGRRERAAGTDATSGSLQKAGLQQGWMLTALSRMLSRDAFQGHLLWTLCSKPFQKQFPKTISRTDF